MFICKEVTYGKSDCYGGDEEETGEDGGAAAQHPRLVELLCLLVCREPNCIKSSDVEHLNLL